MLRKTSNIRKIYNTNCHELCLGVQLISYIRTPNITESSVNFLKPSSHLTGFEAQLWEHLLNMNVIFTTRPVLWHTGKYRNRGNRFSTPTIVHQISSLAGQSGGGGDGVGGNGFDGDGHGWRYDD